MNKSLLFFTGILGVTLFCMAALLGSFQFEDYSPISQLISETYATGTPYGKALRYYGYIPSGILLFLFCLAAPRKFPKSTFIKGGFLGLAVFYGLATIVVSVFPCDPGCNKEFIDPSISQIIHNLTGALTYLFVPVSILIIGLGLRQLKNYSRLSTIALASSGIAIVFVGLLATDPLTPYAGLYQRIVEGSIVVWIVFCAFEIKKGEKSRNSIKTRAIAKRRKIET